MNMSKKRSVFQNVVILIMVIQTIVLTGIIIYLASHKTSEESVPASAVIADGDYKYNEKYVLYIGLNDKDTYTQLVSVREARDIVNGICVRYTDGYTVMEARGGWVDETGTLTEETSLVYTLSNVEEADVTSIMDEVLEALNQNSILVEHQQMAYTYYDGN